MMDIHARARDIRLALFDVDGVLTEGALWFTGAGEEVKVFSVLDGHGLKLLQESGVALGIVTSRSSRAVETRMRNLDIELVRQGVSDKLACFNEIIASRSLAADAVSFMGDDLQDIGVLKRCGLAVSVPDAPAVVRRHAHYVTHARGGHGAVREFCELVLRARGALAAQFARFGS